MYNKLFWAKKYSYHNWNDYTNITSTIAESFPIRNISVQDWQQICSYSQQLTGEAFYSCIGWYLLTWIFNLYKN